MNKISLMRRLFDEEIWLMDSYPHLRVQSSKTFVAMLPIDLVYPTSGGRFFMGLYFDFPLPGNLGTGLQNIQ